MFDVENDVFLPAMLSAILAGVFSFCASYAGPMFVPDSWSYWQGSVSLLQGGGYKNFFPSDFHHVLVAHWPPLFSLYLAGVQWVFGISGFSLILSLVFIAVCSAFVWTYLFCSFCGKENHWVRFVFAASIAALASYFSRFLISDPLSILLVGIVFMCTVRFFSPKSPVYPANPVKPEVFFILFATVLAASMLVRTVNVLLIPAIWLAALFFARTSGWHRPVAVCFVLSALSFLIYYGIFSIFAEPGNNGHKIHFGAHTLETFRYVKEFFLGLGNSFLLGVGDGFSLALMVLVLVYAFWFVVSGGFRFNEDKIRMALPLGVSLLVQVVGVFCLTHIVTYVGSPFHFDERYLWPLTMSLAGACGVVITYFPVSFRKASDFKKVLFPAAFALVCAFQVFSAGKYAFAGVVAHNPPPVLLEPHKFFLDWIWRIPRNHAIRRGYVHRLPTRLPNGTVVVPPFGPFWWQKDADEDVRNFMWTYGQRALPLFEKVKPTDPRRSANPRPTVTHGGKELRLFENTP